MGVDYTKYTGSYVGGQNYKNRKPMMSEARRKVLDLLEFILESKPDSDSVFNVFVRDVMHDDGTELAWVSDEQWAEWLESYAKELQEQERARHRKED